MSELGNLSRCMVDSDAAAKTRGRRLRRKALALSVAAQGLVIAAVMLSPLATLGVLSTPEVVVPVPRFHADETRREALRRSRVASVRPNYGARQVFQPPVIPPHVDMRPDAGPPSIDVAADSGPGIPGGLGEEAVPIEVARPPRPATRTVTRSGELMEAMLVHRVQPDYPTLAKAIALSGTVILHAKIGTDGEVHELEVVSGNPILADAARKAVMLWRYRPTTLGGQAVEVETEITVKFILN
jgi:TonB family protein